MQRIAFPITNFLLANVTCTLRCYIGGMLVLYLVFGYSLNATCRKLCFRRIGREGQRRSLSI